MRRNPSELSGGFTLIELLVVISIIGLLSAVVIAKTSQMRAKARDARRMSDLSQMNLAIQAFIVDHGYQPLAKNSGYDNEDVFDSNAAGWADLGAELKPYITALPHDPCGAKCPGATDYWFAYQYIPHPNHPLNSESYVLKAQTSEISQQAYGYNLNMDSW